MTPHPRTLQVYAIDVAFSSLNWRVGRRFSEFYAFDKLVCVYEIVLIVTVRTDKEEVSIAERCCTTSFSQTEIIGC